MTKQLIIGEYNYDDDLKAATSLDGRPRVSVYRLRDRVIVLGRGSVAEEELHLPACLEDNIPLLRRRGGGCSVLIDPGNVIVSVTLPVKGLGDNRLYLNALGEWLVTALNEAGCRGLRREETSDIVLDDRKVVGSCIERKRGLLLYSASLLVDPDIPLVGRYLKHPPREPAYRRGRPHSDFMGSLKTALGGMSADELAAHLEAALDPRSLLIPAGRLLESLQADRQSKAVGAL